MSAFKLFMDNYGYDVIAVIFIAFFGILIIRNLLRILKKALYGSKIDRSLVAFVTTTIKILLYLFLLFIVLNRLHIPLTGVISALSALTLAIGLALQDIVGGVATSLILVSSKLFKVNDYVSIGGTEGSVKEIKLLHTILVTPDNKTIALPNKTVFNSEIVNYSSYSVRRIDALFGIDYSSDIEKAKDILLSLCKENNKILTTPRPLCVVKELKDSEITLLLRLWVRSGDYWNVTWDLNEKGLKALTSGGIDVPYNQITVSYRGKNE